MWNQYTPFQCLVVPSRQPPRATHRAIDPIKQVGASVKLSGYAGTRAWLDIGDRPSPDRCDSESGCYSWSPTTYPGGGGGRDSFRGRGVRVWGARRGETRGCPIDPASFRTPRRTVEEQRTLKRAFGRFRVRVTSWNTSKVIRWACVCVVPQRVEGLYLRLRRVSMCSMRCRREAMGDFYWGSALLLVSRSLILTQVAALAVWYQPVPGCLRRLPGTG